MTEANERFEARDGQWRRYLRPPLPPSSDAGWLEGWGVPTWRDEFDDPTIDTQKWTVRDNATHGTLSYDWGVIQAANAFIDTGQLVLRISQRGTPQSSGGRDRWWDTAYLDTIGKLDERYGRWEMRAKIPTTAANSRGVWPAFWLRNSDVGEIDIMESWGDPPRRARSTNYTETSDFTLHESTMGGGSRLIFTHEHRTNTPGPPFTTAQGFQTWAVELTPSYIRGEFNGMTTAHITPDGAGGTTAAAWAFGTTFDAPWAIRLNTQMGDNYWTTEPTPDDGPLMPADFIVDYVRYWALPEG